MVGETVQVEIAVEHHSVAVDVVVLSISAFNARGDRVLAGSANVKLLEGVMPLSYAPVEEQAVVVTGGTRGLGATISRTLSSRGAKVIALYRSDDQAARSLTDELQVKSGNRFQTLRCNVQDSEDVSTLFEFLDDEQVVLDGIVHAASPELNTIPFADLSWTEVNRFLETYLKGALQIAQGCLTHFERAPAGRFILIGSEAVASPRRGWLHYVTAKSAYLGLVRSLALELAPLGATANLVSPGLIHTSEVLDSAGKAATARATPLRRLVTDEEVTEAVAFLLEAGGSFMSGAELPLSGGRVFL